MLQLEQRNKTIARRNVRRSDEAILIKIATAFGLAMVLIFCLVPGISFAKTLSFQEKTWEILAEPGQLVEQKLVRNDFNLTDVAQQALTGNNLSQTAQLLDDLTLNLILEIDQTVNQPTKEPKLTIENNRATEFDPGQNGRVLDLYQLRSLITLDTTNIALPIIFSQPKISLADTNNLGIKELVAFGESNFTGSPNNRIHNINVGATKFNGIIVAQGEEFSFNKYLGPVDGEHGFLPELVIKPEGVTPEFGGGLCQVSTTTFRAAMNTGVPITARRNHSFAVQYYAPQGTDATIYPGSSDLKFINNLTSPILIRTRIDGKKLFFEFYGTKDNRTVTFDGPVVYDKKPDGSMKATWTRHVTLAGVTTDQTFKSVYLSPALFHHDPPTAPPVVPVPETIPPPTPPIQ